MLDANIRLTAFAVDDIKAEYDRLTALGVTFRAFAREVPLFPAGLRGVSVDRDGERDARFTLGWSCRAECTK